MEKSYRTSPSVHHCTVAPLTPSTGGRGVVHGKVKGGGVNSLLKSAASGLTTAKREANSSLIEATTLTQVPGSTSSGTRAARRGKCGGVYVHVCYRMSLPCSFTLGDFGHTSIINVRPPIKLNTCFSASIPE